MTSNDLFKEVGAMIRERVDSGQIAHPKWITQAVVDAHSDISGSDAEWYQLCAYEKIRDVVRECTNRYKVKPSLETDQQLLLSSQFEHLQVAYAIKRENEQVVVPVNLLTSNEIETKATELEKMGMGCYEHADELRRYQSERQAAA